MSDEKDIVDIEKVHTAIKMQIPLVVTTYTLPKRAERYIEQVVKVFLLKIFLDYAHHNRLTDNIIYCVQELVVNAKKANTKRVYFIDRGLDLNNHEDYIRGMESFKDDTLNNINYYLDLQRRKGLYIKLLLRLKGDVIVIEVRNNAAITGYELERIRKRMLKAREYDSLEEAMIQLLDDSEGAGLGLVMLVLLLKKLGLGTNAFSIIGTERETIARIIIPRNL
jgi:hypothetical protein